MRKLLSVVSRFAEKALATCKPQRPSLSNRRHCRPRLEALEDRCLLWTALGPAPQAGFIAPPGSTDYGNVNGRVSALAFAQDYYGEGVSALLNGTAGGGILVSSDLSAPNIAWTELTDRVGLTNFDANTARATGALRIGSLAVDPFNSQVIYAGTGEANYSGANSNHGTGVIKSVDGGQAAHPTAKPFTYLWWQPTPGPVRCTRLRCWPRMACTRAAMVDRHGPASRTHWLAVGRSSSPTWSILGARRSLPSSPASVI